MKNKLKMTTPCFGDFCEKIVDSHFFSPGFGFCKVLFLSGLRQAFFEKSRHEFRTYPLVLSKSQDEEEIMVFLERELIVGDEVYIFINPYGFTSKNLFGTVEEVCRDAAFGGGDLYMVRYRDPHEDDEQVRPLRRRYLAPNDPRFLGRMAFHHEEIAFKLRCMIGAPCIRPPT